MYVFVHVCVCLPGVVVLAFSWERHKSGFATKTVRGRDGFVFSFGERGRKKLGQPVIILVPGLAGSIDNWVPVAKVRSILIDIRRSPTSRAGKT